MPTNTDGDELDMGARLIRLGDLLVNPAHVALVERDGYGNVTVHMALARPERAGSGDPLPGHVVVELTDGDAAAAWDKFGSGRDRLSAGRGDPSHPEHTTSAKGEAMPTNSDGSLRPFTTAEVAAMELKAANVRDGSNPTETREIGNSTMRCTWLCKYDEAYNALELIFGNETLYTAGG